MTKQEDDCIEVLRSWNRCHGAFYQVSESDLRWNLTQQTMMRYRADEIGGVPVLLAEASAEGAAAGILEHGIWVSLFGQLPSGRELDFAGAVEEFARKQGKKRIAIGSDEFHFLPGIPVDEPQTARLAEAFKERAFTAADCADFVGSVANPGCVAYIKSASEDAAKRGWSLRLVSDERDRGDLSAFLTREFEGRWNREWKFWQERKDTQRGFWNLLRDEAGKVLGFSRLAMRGRVPDPALGWTPGAIRLPLNPAAGCRNTDSCLGPIGISALERGRGAGKILLGLSLHELSLHGAERTCIDWTNAYNYYTPLSFQIVRKYLTMWKGL